MSYQVSCECNGCGKYRSTNEIFDRITIDISRYIAFSSGWVPRITKLEIHFCKQCYVNIQNSTMHFSTDGTFDKVLLDNERLKKEMHELELDFRTYKATIKKLLEGK